MKKILAIFCLVISMIGCSKEDNPTIPTNTSINISELVSFIGKSPQYIKNNFTNGVLINESGTLGKTELSYRYKTNDTEYRITFNSNTESEMTSIRVVGDFNAYADGIEVYKKEMDLINESINYVTYIARYNGSLSGLMDFSNRNEFWEYVAENDVSKSVTETWWIVNEATRYFTVNGTYDRNINRITVQIEDKIYN